MSNLIVSRPTDLKKIFEQLPDNTRRTYITAINQFLDFFKIGINQIKTIQPADLMTYITDLKTKYSNSTINLKLASLKSLYKKLSVLYGLSNPFDPLKKMKVKTNFKTNKHISKAVVLSEQDIEKLFDYLKSRPAFADRRNYILINLLYTTGLRISEALAIRSEDLKPSNQGAYTIRVNGKGNKEREVINLSDLYDLMKLLSPQGLVFKTATGRPLTRKQFYISLRRLGKRVLKKSISPHTLRHSHINNMLEKNPSKLQAISIYAGHSSASITLDMYVHQEITVKDIQRLAVK